VNALTGEVTEWNPNLSSNGAVYALALFKNRLYAGGYFTSAGDYTRSHLVVLDTQTGLPGAWDPTASDEVLDIVLSSDGKTVFVGGRFAYIGNSVRPSFARFPTNNRRPSNGFLIY
jgi:hypothetical protein